MDELASICQNKLLTFRITELKDVLSRLGMTRQGRKQVLVDRIMNLLASSDIQGIKSNGVGGKKSSVSREDVAKVIDDVFRKMNGGGANDLASKDQNEPKLQATVDEDEKKETSPITVTRCPCGSSKDSGTMIQCDDNKCKVWQHFECVLPGKVAEDGRPDIPNLFYCEACRINRADPFCVTESDHVSPTKLMTSLVSGEGTSPLQNMEKSFFLKFMDKEKLQKPGYDIQVWCILLNDTVMFRMHWPQYTDLRVNGMAVRVTTRPGPQLLGANGRDDGAGISKCVVEGINKISLSAYDARQFCVGVRIIKRRTVQEILSLVPSETEGEPFEENLARVRRCIGGGGSLGNTEDSDSDLEVVADSVTVNLRCPMSGLRMDVAGRFKPCDHMGCFDLKTLVELNERTRKWQCPICMKNYSLENIVRDQYFSLITSAMKNYPEDVAEVEVKPDGSWRPKLPGEAKYQEPWRLPDGSIPILNGDTKSKPQIPNHVKQEDEKPEARTALKIGMKRNRDGFWELSGAKDNQTSSNAFDKKVNNKLSKLPRCSSATASIGDHEDPSVNQEASENLDILVDNDPDFDSALLRLSHPSSSIVNHVNSQLQKESEVIVLSDSEEEIEDEVNIGSSTTSAFAGSDNFAQGGLDRLNSSENLPDEALVSHNDIPFVHSVSSTLNSVPYSGHTPLDLDSFEFNPTNWVANSQDTLLQLFRIDTSAPDSSGNSQHASIVRPTSGTRYNVASHQQMNRSSVSRVPDYARSSDSPATYLNTEVNENRIENLSSIDNGDASLQLFLPSQPARASVNDDTSEPVVNNDMQTNWISLSLGMGNMGGTHAQEAYVAECGRQQTADERNGLDSLANTALNMSNNTTQVGSLDNSGSESPLRHQRPRSVRSRLCLPVESDSD